jgi:hypothetical protein
MPSPPQHCAGATLRSCTQLTRLHHSLTFRYRVAKDDSRRPTSPGLKLTRQPPATKPPASNGIIDNSTVSAAASSSGRIGPGTDRQRACQKAVWLCELFEDSVMMAVRDLDHLARMAPCAPRGTKFA